MIVISIFLIIMCTLFTGCTNNEKDSKIPICKAENCTNPCMNYKIGHETLYELYCEEHTCKEDGCSGQKNYNDDFCSFHMEQQIKLTDSQIEEIRLIVDDYIEQLKSKNNYILAVHLLDDEPYISVTSIKFSCLVIREDTNGKDNGYLAIINIVKDEDSFKVTGLEYVKE